MMRYYLVQFRVHACRPVIGGSRPALVIHNELVPAKDAGTAIEVIRLAYHPYEITEAREIYNDDDQATTA